MLDVFIVATLSFFYSDSAFLWPSEDVTKEMIDENFGNLFAG
jgi:hypothetical protein